MRRYADFSRLAAGELGKIRVATPLLEVKWPS